MSKSTEIYFNFPIQLLKGFLLDSQKCLVNIICYAIYKQSLKYESGTEIEKVESAIKFLKTGGDASGFLLKGKKLYGETATHSPMVGISKTMFFDYFLNYKTEFEKVCLLAFLALRSIIKNKSYIKMDNKFFLARMDGKACSCELSDLSQEIQKYSSRRLLDKVKRELVYNWYLIYYSRYTRGFYVSFNLSLDDLVFEAEKRRKSVKEKQQKQLQDEALQKALSRLDTGPP